MNDNQKYEFIIEELKNLKQQIKDGHKISDDSRKAIIHDISQINKEDNNRKLMVYGTILTAIISCIAFFGFQSVKQTIIEEVAKPEFKKYLAADLEKELSKYNQKIEEAKLILQKTENNIEKIKQKEDEIIKRLYSEEEKLHNIARTLANQSIENIDFKTIIDSDFYMVTPYLDDFKFIKLFGMDETSAVKTLTLISNNFQPSKITKSSLEQAILDVQTKYEIHQDRTFGPCTSLVVGAIHNSLFNSESLILSQNSLFRKNKSLTQLFQACSENDKFMIKRYIENEDLPLNKEFKEYLPIVGINVRDLLDALNTNQIDSRGFKALSHIGESPTMHIREMVTSG